MQTFEHKKLIFYKMNLYLQKFPLPNFGFSYFLGGLPNWASNYEWQIRMKNMMSNILLRLEILQVTNFEVKI